MKILIMNGINLCMVGTREPGKYGSRTLDDILSDVKVWAKTQKDLTVDTFTTNFEGEFVEKLYAARGVYDGIVMNCGAWSHYSIGIRDAVAGCALPCVDVHMTNVYAREEFRHNQVVAPVAVGQVSGFGEDVYRLGVTALISYLERTGK
jgi:3-dehydroquinate dehydratase-2